jgi:hypothetical protein
MLPDPANVGAERFRKLISAVVKSDGGERSGKVETRFRRV